jgi:hypothetical protein
MDLDSSATSVTGIPAPASSTARYLGSATLNSLMSGSVKHQAGQPRIGPAMLLQLLYSFKGAPPARHAYGWNRQREQPGRAERPEDPVISGQGRRGLGVAGRQLSPRPSGGSPTARRAAAHGCPGTGRSRSPPSHPNAAPHEQDQAVTLAPSAPIAVREVTSGSAPRPQEIAERSASQTP